MTMIKRIKSSMAASLIATIVLALLLLGIIISSFGFWGHFRSFRNEYTNTACHIANTAAVMVNGDHIDAYLAGEKTEEYQNSKKYLDIFCQRMGVSLIYVIKVDTEDYQSFESVFNSVNNSVDDSGYTEWPLGHRRKTTNEEYRKIYQDLYENKEVFGTVYRPNPGGGAHPHMTALVPVRNSAGEVTALLCVQRPIREIRRLIRPYLVTIVFITLVLSLFSSWFVVRFLRKQIITPVRKISDEAARFAEESRIGTPLGTISPYREITGLAESIDKMEADMVAYIDNLTAATAERERIETELAFASSIQENALPNEFPAFPGRKDFDIYASMTPAKAVGGDFYNFFLTDEDHLVLMIGDVSGKGVPAALFMMENSILLRERAKSGGTPAEILESVNEYVCGHNKTDMFFTLWMGILDLSTGVVTFANAGHEDAAVCRKGSGFELFRTKHGFVCGGMSGVRYRNSELKLEKGDKLFLFTDGVPEATDGNNRMFAEKRMLDALNEHQDGTPQEILEGVYRNVQHFVGDAPQFDDLTMLGLEYRGKEE